MKYAFAFASGIFSLVGLARFFLVTKDASDSLDNLLFIGIALSFAILYAGTSTDQKI